MNLLIIFKKSYSNTIFSKFYLSDINIHISIILTEIVLSSYMPFCPLNFNVILSLYVSVFLEDDIFDDVFE